MSIADIMLIVTPLLVLAGTIYSKQDRAKQSKMIVTQTEEIHVLVNSRLTEALDRIDQLEKLLGLTPGQSLD